MKKVAVVFDSAGTLVEMYRVALDMKTGRFIPDSNNLRIVSEIQKSGLVILDTPTTSVLSLNPETLISDFIETENIPFGIVYSNELLNPDSISSALKKSGIRIDLLQKLIMEAHDHYDDPVYSVAGFIADISNESILYLLSTGGALFPNAKTVIENVREAGADIYIASGDDKENVNRVAHRLGISEECAWSLCRAENKERIIYNLQNKYDIVFMIGDGINDLSALKSADFGILISRPGYYTPDRLRNAADFIISDLGDCCDIIRDIICKDE